MDFSTISKTWARLGKNDAMIILTDRLRLAEKIKTDNMQLIREINIMDISAEDYKSQISRLAENDLLLVMLTVEGFMNKGYRSCFQPFSKPKGLRCRYIFIRLDIPEPALLSGLNTDPGKIEALIDEYRRFTAGSRVRVTSESGTDITVGIKGQEMLPYDPRLPGSCAFLPPSEISEEIEEAEGIIVADITVGELRFGADLIDSLGLVDLNVRITVENGLITHISGGEIAKRLKEGLSRLKSELQILVELGHGLSDITPTGIIGVDESMNRTCHFGIGSRNPYHVDVVVGNPQFTVIQ